MEAKSMPPDMADSVTFVAISRAISQSVAVVKALTASK
jgi:hypothetical protein